MGIREHVLGLLSRTRVALLGRSRALGCVGVNRSHRRHRLVARLLGLSPRLHEDLRRLLLGG